MKKQTFDVVKLYFRQPLQLSIAKGDQSQLFHVVHSDTLKAALYYLALELFGPWSAEQDIDWQNKIAQISSAFPFFKNQFFFPKPYLKLPFEFEENNPEISHHKKLKNLLFLDHHAMQYVLTNPENTKKIPLKAISADGLYLTLPTINSESKEIKPLSKVAEYQRARIEFNEENNELIRNSVPYYMQTLQFIPESGLYFLLNPNVYNQELEAVIKLLGDNGLGGDRTYGWGTFDFEYIPSAISFEYPENTNFVINLSLYCPTIEEVQQGILQNANYDFIKCGGYISSTTYKYWAGKRKKSVYMFKEGSLFFLQNELSGKIVDLRPDENVGHPIPRCGKSLFLKTFLVHYDENSN